VVKEGKITTECLLPIVTTDSTFYCPSAWQLYCIGSRHPRGQTVATALLGGGECLQMDI